MKIVVILLMNEEAIISIRISFVSRLSSRICPEMVWEAFITAARSRVSPEPDVKVVLNVPANEKCRGAAHEVRRRTGAEI